MTSVTFTSPLPHCQNLIAYITVQWWFREWHHHGVNISLKKGFPVCQKCERKKNKQTKKLNWYLVSSALLVFFIIIFLFLNFADCSLIGVEALRGKPLTGGQACEVTEEWVGVTLTVWSLFLFFSFLFFFIHPNNHFIPQTGSLPSPGAIAAAHICYYSSQLSLKPYGKSIKCRSLGVHCHYQHMMINGTHNIFQQCIYVTPEQFSELKTHSRQVWCWDR